MSNQFSTEISKALNSLFEGIVIINPEGEILWANNKSIEIFLAKSTNDLIGQSVGQYFHDLYKMQIIKAADNLINNKLKSFEKEVVLQINKEEFVPCKLKLEKFDDESLIIYLLNLSTEKKIEERLFETTEQINAIIKTAVDGIITIDQKGLIETVNPAKIPFIFLTAKVDKEDIRRGMVICKTGSVTPHAKFKAEVYILKKEEGGRHTPFHNNYRPQFYVRTTDVTGNISLPDGVEMVMPGDNLTINVDLIQPIALSLGLRFAIREGGRTVGAGQVTEILD